jgi:hypothetical protein
LNIRGINSGSEAEKMARGREVFWPDVPEDPRLLFVGGHIHEEQVYRGIYVVGSPVRFDFNEEGHYPKTFEARFNASAGSWEVWRRRLEEDLGLKLRRFHSDFMISEGLKDPRFNSFDPGDFVRAVPDDEGKLAAAVESAGAIFLPMPKLAEAKPKAGAKQEAKKHRRVREVVLDVARKYPTAEGGLIASVTRTMDEEGI